MSLEDKKPKELETIVSYFLDRSAEGVRLAEEALAQLRNLAEGGPIEELPVRDDNTILHALPRAREGFTIPKVSKPYDQENDTGDVNE